MYDRYKVIRIGGRLESGVNICENIFLLPLPAAQAQMCSKDIIKNAVARVTLLFPSLKCLRRNYSLTSFSNEVKCIESISFCFAKKYLKMKDNVTRGSISCCRFEMINAILRITFWQKMINTTCQLKTNMMTAQKQHI